VDLWTADKAGTLSLHARTGISGVDANPVNLTRNLRPADEVLMGGPKNDLYIVVTAWTNMTAATIRLVGTDASGAAQTEDIVVTGNGTYNATKLFKTLSQSQVTVFTKSDTGSFAYEVLQGQWGVVWRPSPVPTWEAYFHFDAKIQIGDGTTATWFADTNKLVEFYPMVDPNIGILVKNNATFRLGVLVDAAKKIGRSGCFMLDLGATGWGFIISGISGTIYLYGCAFASLGKNTYIEFRGNGRAWQCLWNWSTTPMFTATATGDVFQQTNVFCQSGIQTRTSNITVDRLNVFSNGTMYGISFRYMSSSSATITNPYVRNVQYTVEIQSVTNSNCYVVNMDYDSENWTFAWYGTDTGTRVYRQYTVNLKVTDKDNNPINGATVTLKDKDGNQVFSVNTDANGNIVTQTVSRGYYDQAHGNTLQDYSPHILTITKLGYQTYVKEFTLSAKTAWEVKLAKAQHILLNSGRPVLNLKPSDPENKSVVVL
jgi:hypothetical protein